MSMRLNARASLPEVCARPGATGRGLRGGSPLAVEKRVDAQRDGAPTATARGRIGILVLLCGEKRPQVKDHAGEVRLAETFETSRVRWNPSWLCYPRAGSVV